LHGLGHDPGNFGFQASQTQPEARSAGCLGDRQHGKDLKSIEAGTEDLIMDISAISGSSNAADLSGQIQLTMLKKTQDLQAGVMAKLLESTQASPDLGNKVNLIA
jgi:hypothetical protein